MNSDQIAQLAKDNGITLEFENARGELVRASLDAQVSLLQAMGALSADGKTKQPNLDGKLPAAIVVLVRDGAIEVDLGPYLSAGGSSAWRLSLETGEQLHGVISDNREKVALK